MVDSGDGKRKEPAMDVFEAIDRRHSYRGAFTGKPVPREDLRRIVQAGIQAPSGMNRQTTAFVIVDDPETLSRVSALEGANPAVRDMKALVACVVDEQATPIYEGMSFEVEDCAAAVENMLLAVTALGYATVWVDGWLRVEGRGRRVADLLGVPAGKTVRIILPLGVPAEEKAQAPKQPFEERAFFNRYGGAV